MFEFFEWWHFLALFGAGLLTGAISPVFGIGGGLLNVPILLIAFETLLVSKVGGQAAVLDNPNLLGNTASATSLGVIVFTALSGSISYIREKRIDYQVALRFMVFAIPGAVSGGLFSKWLVTTTVRKDIFQIIFGVTMIAIALYKMFSIVLNWIKERSGKFNDDKDECLEEDCDEEQKIKEWWQKSVFYREFTDKRGIKFKYKAKLFPGIIIATVGGFIGATLGLGGGVIYVPILTMAIGMPAPIAAATSTFTILFATPFAVLIRSLDIFNSGSSLFYAVPSDLLSKSLGSLGVSCVSIQWDIVLLMAIGTVITANIIPRFLHKVKSEAILIGFWSLATFAAVRVLLKALDIIDW